ncbi:hypothetical protein DL768_003938 [Monosporascus sp. mg162]|nr:hypothetical protein DL768_003938 [Monosporascus sp. mg162]
MHLTATSSRTSVTGANYLGSLHRTHLVQGVPAYVLPFSVPWRAVYDRTVRRLKPDAAKERGPDSELSAESEDEGAEVTLPELYVSRPVARELALDETAFNPKASRQFYDRIRQVQAKDLDIQGLVKLAQKSAGIKGVTMWTQIANNPPSSISHSKTAVAAQYK